MNFYIDDIIEFTSVKTGELVPATVTQVDLDHLGDVKALLVKYIGHETNEEITSWLDKALITRKLAAPSTHAYKVGDVVRWHGDVAENHYEITNLQPDFDRYSVKNIRSGKTWPNHHVKPEQTSRVSVDAQAPVAIVDRCKWSTPQPIDVEPIYYRIYISHDGSVMQSEQARSSHALVAKRAQHHGVRAVPFCGFADKPISIIGKSVPEGDRWKAEAFLYCEHCGTDT